MYRFNRPGCQSGPLGRKTKALSRSAKPLRLPQTVKLPPQTPERPPQTVKLSPQTAGRTPQRDFRPPQTVELPPQTTDFPPQPVKRLPQTDLSPPQTVELSPQGRFPPGWRFFDWFTVQFLDWSVRFRDGEGRFLMADCQTRERGFATRRKPVWSTHSQQFSFWPGARDLSGFMVRHPERFRAISCASGCRKLKRTEVCAP